MNQQSLSIGSRLMCRRGFLQVGTVGIAGLSLADLLRTEAAAELGAPAPIAKNVIMLFLTGGPATIDMWDMKPGAPDKIRGDFKPISTAVSGVQICEYMPKLAAALGHVALVRSV